MHRLRVLSALLLLLPFLAVVQLGSPLHFHLVLSLAILLCAWEFAWLCPLGASFGMATLLAVSSLVWQWALIGGVEPVVVAPLVAVAMLIRALGTGDEVVEDARRGGGTDGSAHAGRSRP